MFGWRRLAAETIHEVQREVNYAQIIGFIDRFAVYKRWIFKHLIKTLFIAWVINTSHILKRYEFMAREINCQLIYITHTFARSPVLHTTARTICIAEFCSRETESDFHESSKSRIRKPTNLNAKGFFSRCSLSIFPHSKLVQFARAIKCHKSCIGRKAEKGWTLS